MSNVADVLRVFMDVLPLGAAVTLTAHGLIVMFFGFRLYRLWALLQGIGVGACLSVFVASRYVPDYPLLHYFLGLIGAGLGGAIFFYVSVFFFGANMGIAVMYVLNGLWLHYRGGELEGADIMTFMVSYAIAGVTAGTLAVLFKRPFLIFITSTGGAAMALMGTALAASSEQVQSVIDDTASCIAAGLAFVALGTTGAIVQWKTAAEPVRIFGEPEPGEDKKSKSKAKKGKPKTEDDA